MVAQITIRRDYEPDDLRRLAARTRNGAQSRRLLAMALVLEGKCRNEAARLCGMDRQILCDWVHRFNAGGPEGLKNRKPSGRQCRVNDEQKAALAEIVRRGPDIEQDGVVRWRRVDLRDWIVANFGVQYHERTIGKLLHGLGFSHISARPCHPSSRREDQETYKKTARSGL